MRLPLNWQSMREWLAWRRGSGTNWKFTHQDLGKTPLIQQYQMRIYQQLVYLWLTYIHHWDFTTKQVNLRLITWPKDIDLAVCQNLVPLVNIKIAGKWMFIPLKMVLIGIDPYPFIKSGHGHLIWHDFPSGRGFMVNSHGISVHPMNDGPCGRPSMNVVNPRTKPPKKCQKGTFCNTRW